LRDIPASYRDYGESLSHIFSISGNVQGISSASLWSRIFNIRLLISETRRGHASTRRNRCRFRKLYPLSDMASPSFKGSSMIPDDLRSGMPSEYRDAEGKFERLPLAADELVSLNPDLIFSFGGEVAPIVKKATAAIPIVVVVSNDPVESGLVASLGRPGGNITGVTWVHDQLAGKSVELLKDTAPSVSRAAILWNPNHTDPEFRETQRASHALEVQLQSLEVREPGDYEGAFQAAERGRAEALIVLGSRLMFLNRQRIGDFAAKNRLVMVGVPSWLMEIGGLLNYGPNVPELTRRAATYVDKILKGAKPADLPMQQPTAFELTINAKRAKELGITVPPTVIARADKVID
jgi:putative ABC transport system substrate-binding protein